MPEVKTIDGVIDQLDRMIEVAAREESRLGYFPCLYRKVTVRVKEGIAQGEFDDGPRMERLDVIFANRYLRAWDAWRAGRRTTLAWEEAFRAGDEDDHLVLQHLLLGMNAHINLDLGVAAVRTAGSGDLAPLHDDFMRINAVLASLLGEVKGELSRIWPLMTALDVLSGDLDDRLVNFSLEKARNMAWRNALALAPLSSSGQRGRIRNIDRWAGEFARKLKDPGAIASAQIAVARTCERGSVPERIDILRAVASSAGSGPPRRG